MANKKHVEMLRMSVKVWNKWKKNNQYDKNDLRSADLSCADLRNANLNGADLEGIHINSANLSGASLNHANLKGANLHSADLRSASLNNADLSYSYLTSANLSGANLSNANLTCGCLLEANLTSVNLNEANLNEADFRNSRLGRTVFGFQNLNTCKGLESVIVESECIIDYKTLITSKKTPKSFLKKIGLPDIFIDYIPEFRDPSPIHFFSVFLSHSSLNKDFVEKLYDVLINKNVQAWYDEKKLLPGDMIIDSIDKGIRLYDKTLLVCSKDALESWWIERELNKVLKKEREYQKKNKTKESLLIPITIDKYIYKSEHSFASVIQERKIGDFTKWKNPEIFEQKVKELIEALNVDRKDDKPFSFLK